MKKNSIISKLKKKVTKKDLVIIIVCFILTLFRLLIDINMPMFIQSDAIYDDRLLFDYAHSLSEFHWLGVFQSLTLAKPIGYSLFVCITHFLHIPLSFMTMLYYIISILLFVISLKRIINNKLFLVILYIILIFCPITFGVGAFKVIYRNGVQISSTIMVIAATIGIFSRRNEKKKFIFWIIIETIFLSFFYFVKEDGIWLIPFVLVALLITFIYMLVENKKKLSKKMILLVVPFVFLGISSIAYKSINYYCYGEYTITDRTGTNFHLVLNDIMSIKSKHTKNSWVTKKTIYKALNASPTLSKYRKAIDDNMYVDWGLTSDGEMQTDLFYWRLRYSLAVGGLYDTSGKEVNKFYGKVHKELQEAFKNGKLEKEDNVYHVSSSLPNYNKKELKGLIKIVFPMLKVIYSYSSADSDIALLKSTGSAEQIELVRSFTKSKIYKDDKNSKSAAKIAINITKIYQIFGLKVGIIGIIGNLIFIVLSLFDIKNKRYERLPQLLIELGMIFTFILYYIVILWFGYKFTNQSGIIYGYMHPAHIILNILTIIGVYNIISITYNKIKLILQ